MGHSAVVLGASGYAGGEVLRLLEQHPEIEIRAASGGGQAGAALASVHPHLAGVAAGDLLSIEDACSVSANVLFSCLPSGRLRELIGGLAMDLVIDLSDDFRGAGGADSWIYGLTEYARTRLGGAARVANPGCYPTASLLALVPFARAGLVRDPVIVDALSGVSGAGRQAEDRLLFSGLAANAMAYGTISHRHLPEIEQGLARFGGADLRVSFTPHLVPMARGLLVTARAPLVASLSDHDAIDCLTEAYADEAFVTVIPEWPATKSVHGTNRAHVSARVDARNGLLVCSTAIDNLGKGAAGQAIQNANVALGLDEDLGLGALGVAP